MQPHERPSYAEGLTTTPQVRPGELIRTSITTGDTIVAGVGRLPITTSHVHHGPPPRVHVRS